MQRLGGLDAAFLAAETQASPMHVGWLCLCERSVPGPPRERLRRHLEPRLGLVPSLRRRIVEVPGGLHRPVFVEDPDFSLDAHLRSVCLPRPDRRSLERFVAAEMADPLDRGRPLWDAVVVEGVEGCAFEGDRYAVLARVHHAVADGVAGLRFAAALLTVSPDAPPPPPTPWHPEPLPTPAELVAGALAELCGRLGERLERLSDARHALAWLVGTPQHASPGAPGNETRRAFRAPRTPLNGALTPRRAVAFAELPLDAVKALGARAGATVNDVLLAVCASALRALLAELDALPGEDLVAMVPVSARAPDEDEGAGNRISAMFVALPTTEADTARRLALAARAARAAKATAARTGATWLVSTTDLLPPAMVSAAARLAGATRIFDVAPPVANVIVSDVVGPAQRLWLASDPLVAAYPLGPLAEGIGLNVTAVSYAETLWIGLVACPDLVPDVGRLGTLIGAAFAELDEAWGARRRPRAGPGAGAATGSRARPRAGAGPRVAAEAEARTRPDPRW